MRYINIIYNMHEFAAAVAATAAVGVILYFYCWSLLLTTPRAHSLSGVSYDRQFSLNILLSFTKSEHNLCCNNLDSLQRADEGESDCRNILCEIQIETKKRQK